MNTRRPVAPTGRRVCAPTDPIPAAQAGNATAPTVKRTSTKSLVAKGPKSQPLTATVVLAAVPEPEPKASQKNISQPKPKRTSVREVAAHLPPVNSEQILKRLDDWESAAQHNSQPEKLTARTLLGAIVVLLVAALIVPTMRNVISQTSQLATSRAQLAAAQEKRDRLDHEISRWDDPVYVEAQARAQKRYVRPGDKVWLPIGGDNLAEDIDPLTEERVEDGVVGATAGQPWFDALLESFLVANGPIDQGPVDLTEILNRAKDN